VANEKGVATVDMTDSQISLVPGDKLDIRGRSLVVHEKRDDLGLGGDEESEFLFSLDRSSPPGYSQGHY